MLTANTTDYEIRRAREALSVELGSLDAKRPTAWAQYGYSLTVGFEQLLLAYERGGPGHGAVHRLLDKCWQETPRIKQPDADEETDWEKSVGKVFAAAGAWVKLRDLDRRNMVGQFAALIYRVADGLPLREPMGKASKLVDLVPLYQDQIKVTEWFSDTNDPDTYGRPKMFQFKSRRINSHPSDITAGQPIEFLDVHPSRVQILAEGSVGDFADGVPLLKAGFNSLVDLEKIAGGSAESFLKNSARTLSFKFASDANPLVITQNADGSAGMRTVKEVVEEQTRSLNRNQDSSVVTQGADVTSLQTTISDPTGAFHLAANLFAASVQIPFTILFGQQTGRLASGEDKADMVNRCKSRQRNELTPMLEQFVRRMQDAGIIEAGEFEIEWPQLDAPGDDAKMGVVNKMTASMQQAFAAGLTEPLFDANELRAVAGFEPRPDDGMPTEADKAREDAAAAAAMQQDAAAASSKQSDPNAKPKGPK